MCVCWRVVRRAATPCRPPSVRRGSSGPGRIVHVRTPVSRRTRLGWLSGHWAAASALGAAVPILRQVLRRPGPGQRLPDRNTADGGAVRRPAAHEHGGARTRLRRLPGTNLPSRGEANRGRRQLAGLPLRGGRLPAQRPLGAASWRPALRREPRGRHGRILGGPRAATWRRQER